MAGVLVALLASCEKSESEVEVVPSTPEELLEFCQGKWVRVSYVDYDNRWTECELGFRSALFFDGEMMYKMQTDEQESGLLPLDDSHEMVSNDGKEMVFKDFSTAIGLSTGVVCYEEN